MVVPQRITLDIDTNGPPIQGRLLTTPDLVRTFTGWMSLMAALDAAIGDRGDDAPVCGDPLETDAGRGTTETTYSGLSTPSEEK
jgi:hypothetical protein